MFFELGSALARRPSARLKRLCPFTIFTNCFGSKVRDSGQSLVPEPPHRIIFVMFFLFLCEILRHYSKIWQIDLNLFLFFAFFTSHPLVGGAGVSRYVILGLDPRISIGNFRISINAKSSRNFKFFVMRSPDQVGG